MDLTGHQKHHLSGWLRPYPKLVLPLDFVVIKSYCFKCVGFLLLAIKRFLSDTNNKQNKNSNKIKINGEIYLLWLNKKVVQNILIQKIPE